MRNVALYWGRLALVVGLSIAYAGTYGNLGRSFADVQNREVVFFIVSCVLPFLAILAVPNYANMEMVEYWRF